MRTLNEFLGKAREINTQFAAVNLEDLQTRRESASKIGLDQLSSDLCSNANFKSAWLPCNSSFVAMLVRWLSTVRALINSSAAISLLVLLSAINFRIRRSVGVRSFKPGFSSANLPARV